MGQFWDQLAGGDAVSNDVWSVGPQSDGTIAVPDNAQPNNQPWDTPGGVQGQYNSDVIGLLTQGIAAWSQNKARSDFVDYAQYQATNGGVFRVGRPAGTVVPQAAATVKTGGGVMLMVLLVGVLLLKKL